MPLIVQTIERLKGLVDVVYIITTSEQRDIFNLMIKDIDMKNLLVEPFGRNTAPAIALGSMYFNPQDVMVVHKPSYRVWLHRARRGFFNRAEQFSRKKVPRKTNL